MRKPFLSTKFKVLSVLLISLPILFLLNRRFPVVMPVIQLPAEPAFVVFGVTITNTLLASWVSMVILVVLSYVGTRSMALIPSGIQNSLEFVVESGYNFCESVAGERTRAFFPIVMTFFLFILVSNWTGLLPGYGTIGWMEHPHEGSGHAIEEPVPGLALLTAQEAEAAEGEEHGAGWVLVPWLRGASTDLSFTMAMAIIVMVLVQYFGFKYVGRKYLKKFFNFGDPIGIFVGFLELVSEFAKIISFSFRLFGNIFAGEVLLIVIAFLIPFFFSLPFMGLEVFVGAMQAFVFMILPLIFFTMASTAEH